MREKLEPSDTGKRVLNADGTAVGRIADVENGRGYVVLDPGLTETIKAKLGWGSVTDEAHPLDSGSIEKITDDAVYLRGTL
ncbi:PRC-barrel domain containing protein [Halostagnicola sp. A-GB9-2]|uniref:PRC-barrel domain containing protein n=1 Tax=Halostagnicola sp. A-GB9-2 TaxID=3048066 RepID=UPI0024C0CECE|nr:PRC-barrel domain containing protein [Halostagnicola sp. A-GB9-2]MDJ1432326.1 PRC-barrel domain containing protein [Halostagnicola sp. A-GB9-2]